MTSWRERARAFTGNPNRTTYKAQVEQLKELQRQQENRRTIPMGKYKTRRGDTVELPEGTARLREQADDVYASAIEAFDAVQEVKRRTTALASATPIDRGRFPGVRGEQ